jgi:hypothetical protein
LGSHVDYCPDYEAYRPDQIKPVRHHFITPGDPILKPRLRDNGWIFVFGGQCITRSWQYSSGTKLISNKVN